jgi:hypothetical protein
MSLSFYHFYNAFLNFHKSLSFNYLLFSYYAFESGKFEVSSLVKWSIQYIDINTQTTHSRHYKNLIERIILFVNFRYSLQLVLQS